MKGINYIRLGSLGLISTSVKELDRSTRYDHLFAVPDWQQRIVRRSGNIIDVVADIQKVITAYSYQTKAFAPYMRGSSIYETCRNIWTFWYRRAYYKEDVRGLEQLRTPARSYWEGAGFNPNEKEDYGIDCDDFSIAVATTLLNLGIPCKLRIARYAGVDYFQHIYVVVPIGKKQIVIDCVLDAFDTEKPPVEIKDYFVMSTNNLNGIDVAILSGISDTPLVDIITGSDFSGLEGFAGNEDKELEAIYQHLVKTRQVVSENPELVKEAEHPDSLLKMLDYAIQYWHTDKRDEALAILAQREAEVNQLRGFGPGADTSESEIEYRALAGGGYVAIGKIGGERKFFDKVKDAVKKAGNGLKEAGKAVVKYNPLSLAARGGLLLAMQTNLFHMAEHLKWGYLTEDEARKQGFDMVEWAKCRDSLKNTEEMYTKVLQGEATALRDAILKGRAGNVNTVSLGALGVEPVTTAATTAAATGFLAKIKAWIKGIDLKKMFKKVNVKKLTATVQTAMQAKPDLQNRSADEFLPEDDGSNRKADEGGMGALPFILLGGVGLAMMMGGKKEKPVYGYAGFGSTKKKKSKKKKQLGGEFDVYHIPALTGTEEQGEFIPGPRKSKNKKKGATKKKGNVKRKFR